MTRTPRASLSPDAIKLIVKVLRGAVKTLDDMQAKDEMSARVTLTVDDITVDLETVIDACTEEAKS